MLRKCPETALPFRLLALCAAAGLGTWHVPASAGPDAEKSEVLNLWANGRYPQAYKAGVDYARRHGRDFLVDYMTGTSACRIATARAWGYEFLWAAYLVHAERMTSRQNRIFREEIQLCQGAWSQPVRDRYAGTKLRLVGAVGAAWTPPGTQSDQGADPSDGLESLIPPAGALDAFKREAPDLADPAPDQVAPCGGDLCIELDF